MRLASAEKTVFQELMRELVPLNRTIVSDEMDRAADLLDEAVGQPAVRTCYKTGEEHGTWVVPPGWNVREAFLSDGEKTLASYKDHVLFLAPYSMPFEGWVSRQELMEHLVVSEAFEDVYRYQHRVAYDFQKRLNRWEISLPKRIVESLNRERYYLKIDVEVRPGTMNVLEYTAPGSDPTTVALLGHLCHPGQANDGLSGVLAGVALLQRFLSVPHRYTYKLLTFPETIGSAIHVAAQRLSSERIYCAMFLETMGYGDRLFLKKSRRSDHPVDWVIRSIARERPEVGLLDFFGGYGNDELIFDFANVGIPSIGVQYYPFREYHTSRDNAELIDWGKWEQSVELAWEVLQRLETNPPIRLKYPGPPYLTRYQLYADGVTERPRWKQTNQLLNLCDGRHSLLQMVEETGFPLKEVQAFFAALKKAGLLDES